MRKRQAHTKDMMTPREVAEESGIGVNAVYLLIKERHIPSISIGRDILVPRPQYIRWLETVEGTFNGPASRNHKPRVKSYWESMTPEQRSEEVRRRISRRK